MEMEKILFLGLVGMIGGTVRAIVGYTKYLKETSGSKKRKKPDILLFSFTLFTGAITGGLAGVLIEDDWRLALIVGYAGSDFIEGSLRSFLSLPKRS